MSSLRTRADAKAQVFVEDVSAPVLDESDAHHLIKVLRLRTGERVVAADGRGTWAICEIGDDGQLHPIGDAQVEPDALDPICVWLPAVKGERAEWAVAKLTELGVDTIGLLVCDRATVRIDATTAPRVLERWQRVAREASCQSRRVRMPAIEAPSELAGVLGRGALACDIDGAPLPGTARSIAVGPEGGWSDAELAAAAARYSIGTGVLRTETAAVAAGVLLGASRIAAATNGQ